MIDDGAMEEGVHPVWRQLVDALEAEVGLDQPVVGFESNEEMLTVRCDVKGFDSSYYLIRRVLFDPDNASGEATELAEHVLAARWLQEGGNVAPYERRLPRDELADAILNYAKIDVQALLDEMWSARVDARAAGKDGGRFRWATDPRNPIILHGRNGRPGVEPRAWGSRPIPGIFIAGDLVDVGWEIDTIVLDDRVAIHYENRGVVVSFRDQLPETLIGSLKGRPLSQVVTHTALEPLDIRITAARRRGALTALWIRVLGSTLPKTRRRPAAGPARLAAVVDNGIRGSRGELDLGRLAQGA